MVTRKQAFLIHLGISAVIFLALLYLIVFVWYPQPYFGADGGWQGIQIITGVDLILGPLLTLIVYKPNKPSLKVDLIIIALLQTIALTWGAWLVYDQRTAMVTFADGTFYSLPKEPIEMAGYKAKDFLEKAEHLPTYAVVRLPEDPNELQKLRLAALTHGVPMYGFGDRYEALNPTTLAIVFTHSIDLQSAAQEMPNVATALNDFLNRHGGDAAAYAFLALQCRYQRLVLALRRQDGAVMETLDIDPDTLMRYRPAATEHKSK